MTPLAKERLLKLNQERKEAADEVLKSGGVGFADSHVYQWELPFIDGVTIILQDASGEDGFPEGKNTLDRDSLKEGLSLMAEKYPKHFSYFMDENEDANTGDIFLQLCVFGEVVFG